MLARLSQDLRRLARTLTPAAAKENGQQMNRLYQRQRGKQSGLQTRIAATEGASLCVRMKN